MTYLFLLRQSPYGSTLAREALDMALATAAFDQKVQLVFLNDGVYQLLQDQQAELKQRKNISKTLLALELYEIEEVYADEQSIKERGLHTYQLAENIRYLNNEQISILIKQADAVMSL